MTVYYAARSNHPTNPGDDGNPGTQAQPLSIRDAWSATGPVQPGDTVRVYGGRSPTASKDNLSQTIAPGQSGGLAAPITWEAVDPADPPIFTRATYFSSSNGAVEHLIFKDMQWLSLQGDYGIRSTSFPQVAADLQFYRCHFEQEKYVAGGAFQKGWLIYFYRAHRLRFVDCSLGSWWGGEHNTGKFTECDDVTWVGGDWSEARSGHGCIELINCRRWLFRGLLVHNVWNRSFTVEHEDGREGAQYNEDGLLEGSAFVNCNWPYDRGEGTGNGDVPEDAARYDDSDPAEGMGAQQEVRWAGRRNIMRDCVLLGHYIGKHYSSPTVPEGFINMFLSAPETLVEDNRFYHCSFHLQRANSQSDAGGIFNVSMKSGDPPSYRTARNYFYNNIFGSSLIWPVLIGSTALDNEDHLTNWRFHGNLFTPPDAEIMRDNQQGGDPRFTLAQLEAQYPAVWVPPNAAWNNVARVGARAEFAATTDTKLQQLIDQEVIIQSPNGPAEFQLAQYDAPFGSPGFTLEDFFADYRLRATALQGRGIARPLALVTQNDAGVTVIQVDDGWALWPGNYYEPGDQIIVGQNVRRVTARTATSLTLDAPVTVSDGDEVHLAAVGAGGDPGPFPATPPTFPGSGDLAGTGASTSGATGTLARTRQLIGAVAAGNSGGDGTIGAPGEWSPWTDVGEIDHPATEFTDFSILTSLEYEYRVRAVDYAGNDSAATSAQSIEVSELPRILARDRRGRSVRLESAARSNRRLV